MIDECGVCNGDNSICTDCAGVVNGTAEIDCNGDCNGTSLEDACGVCNGDNSTCLIDCPDEYMSIPGAIILDNLTTGDYLGNLCYYNDDVIVLKEDNISDFQIEGMSIDDSLFKYNSEKKIKENIIELFKYY